MSRAIELLIERVAEEEELARKLFAKATGDADFAEQQLDALNGFRESYTQRLTEEGAAGMDSSQLAHYNAFIDKLDGAAESQTAVLRTARDQAEKYREKWLSIKGRRKALETLLEKQRERERIAQMKKEQKVSDEAALNSFMRRLKSEASNDESDDGLL